MTSTIQVWMNLVLNITFKKWMTNTIPFWMYIMLNNILPKTIPPKMDDQFWMDIMLNFHPKMDDQYNPILDGYYDK